MNDKTNLIDDEIPIYRKKSKKKGRPRADHKHTYETVLLIRYHHFNFGEPSISEFKRPTKVCTICGRIDEIDKDESLYEAHPDPTVKRWMWWLKDLSEKALNLPKWYVDDLDKFATKMEDEDDKF
jgi:hypothetical protein